MNRVLYNKLCKVAEAPALYEVTRGDNYWNLDKKFGLPVGSFEDANPNVKAESLRPGQKLVIPKAKPKPRLPKYLGPTEKTMRIIHHLESSSGKSLSGDYREDSGKYHSIGPFHIREVYNSELPHYLALRGDKPKSYSAAIDEVNDLFNTEHSLSDRTDYDKARFITSRYMYILGNKFVNKYGRLPTESEVARMYNGGIGGMNSEKAVNYGKKFDRLSGGPRLVKPSPWQTSGYIKAFDEMRLLDPYYEAKMKALRALDQKRREAYEASGAIVNK